MMRRSLRLVLVAMMLLGTTAWTPLDAHEPFRIEGTIVTFKDRALAVRSRSGESFTFQLQRSTVVRRDKERVPQTELEAGRRVVVTIMADSLYDENPFVLSVILPAITPPEDR